jgi:iron-sulfur cluster assembly protein
LCHILRRNNAKAALFYAEGGGCNGLRYKIEPVKTPPQKGDEIIALNDDHELRVCGKSLLHLWGTKIDWKSDFMGETFHFENPNTAGTCGCGATFTPKDL